MPDLDNLPPHAAMPGAPPYPAAVELPPPPVGAPSVHTGIVAVPAAAAAWALVNLAVALLVGVTGSGTALTAGLALTALLTAGIVWFPARQRGWSFVVLLFVTAPVFWILRAVVATLLG